jgi:hypothetical protein
MLQTWMKSRMHTHADVVTDVALLGVISSYFGVHRLCNVTGVHSFIARWSVTGHKALVSSALLLVSLHRAMEAHKTYHRPALHPAKAPVQKAK